MRFLLAAVLLLGALPAHAQTDKEITTSQYEKDVVALYGAIAAIRDLVATCADLYPQTLRPNRAAFQQWRFHYLAFQHEVERRVAAVIRNRTGNDRNQQMGVIMQLDDAFELQRQKSRRDLLAKEERVSRGSCTGYPLYLRTERGDFEKRFAERVASMRSRPE
jgi:hypothetical protein